MKFKTGREENCYVKTVEKYVLVFRYVYILVWRYYRRHCPTYC